MKLLINRYPDMYIRIYRNFAFLANIGHISVGYRHDRPTMCGKLNAHQRGIDPALISGGLGVEARILVVKWLLYLFTYLTIRYGSNPPTRAVAAPLLLRRKYTLSSSE